MDNVAPKYLIVFSKRLIETKNRLVIFEFIKNDSFCKFSKELGHFKRIRSIAPPFAEDNLIG